MGVKDLRGSRFDRLSVIRYVGESKWECRCECGKTVVVNGNNMKNGHTKSCGCLKLENSVKHGKCATPEYTVWVNLRRRCNEPGHPSFARYGGRGIKMCAEWMSFKRFFSDVGPRPSSLHSIDRINNEGNYEPGNVRWATQSQQMSNTRATHFIEIDGIRQTVTEWAKQKGIAQSTISHRIARGMSETDAVMTSPRFGGRRVTNASNVVRST